ncbi:protein disulfide-isomerase [Diaporthe helianthi]|uniref:Protein disulfide-isomerase n=1 Tax=Diaporthe helianthi TaxID=158607 RepID=A0A2P5I7P7_DIAHE|nr:protein disulfide-isomerase [Diaporthe helianthi]
MRLFRSLTLGWLGLAASALAEDPSTESAVELIPGTFRDFIKENGVVMAEFYAPWCRHCQTFAPKYEAAAKTLREQNIDVKLAKIDCQRFSTFCQDYMITAFPTLKIFKEGRELYHEYDGPRRSSAIVDFVKKQVLATVNTLSTKALHDGFLDKEKEEIVLIGYFDKDDSVAKGALLAAAEKLHEDFPIGMTNNPEAAAAAGVSFPSIVMYEPNGEGKEVYKGDIEDIEAIKTFAKATYTPLIGELDYSTWRNYVSGSNGPTAFIFSRTDDDRRAIMDELRPLAKKLKGRLAFATAETPDFGGFAGYLHLANGAEKDFPAFAIYDGIKRVKHPYTTQGSIKDLSAGNIGRFADDFLAGRLKPVVKSEPIPSTQTGPVTTVVADSFENVVLDHSKDVLLYYFREDCPYCKALAPVYDALAKTYGSSNVVIAKMDIMKNDLPEDVPYVPWVRLYRADDKSNPISYEGQRTHSDLVRFIKENAHHGAEPIGQGQQQQQVVDGGAEQVPMGAGEEIHETPLQGHTPVKHIHDEL